MIPAYNCADHLGAAIESVLAQDPGPERMQIEVVDDCSDDGTADVAARFGERVSLLRQPRNLGNVGNFNACLARARGHLIHLLHGDDAVRPGFYERLQAPLSGSAAIGAAFCRYIAIDGDGNWTGVSPLESAAAGVLDGWVETLALGQRLQPPCIAVRREAYERLGGFDDRISYSEDWEMWTRIARCLRGLARPHPARPLPGPRGHDQRPDAAQRRQRRRPAQGDRDEPRIAARRAGREITREALRITAITALRRGRRRLGAGDTEAAAAQLREALATSRSARVLGGALLLQLLRVRRWILVGLGRR